LTLRDNYLTIIYKGFIDKKSAKEIHKELYDLTINKKVVDKTMLSNAIKITNKVAKNKPANLQGDLLADAIFLLFADMKADKYLTQNIYQKLNKEEGKAKEEALSQELVNNRKLTDPKIFYLASSHNDCASDHKDYQGKMYIDENWRSVIKDKEQERQISAYIRQHNIKGYNWVIGRPVWLITRPNCRHYFTALPTEKVLNNSVETLTRNYKTHRAYGDRQYLQTISQDKKRKLIGEERNAELMIEKYKERLNTHTELYKTFKSSLVRASINKDKLLIKKWSDYLAKLRGY